MKERSKIRYGTFGPFKLPREAGVVTRECLEKFWSTARANSSFADIHDGIGVYVLTTKSGPTYTPWYVGLTRSTFRRRFYQHGDNKTKSPFVKLAKHKDEGSIYVFLLPRMTSPSRLMKSTIGATKRRRKTTIKSITELEFMLIGRCLSVNADLLNVSEKAFQAGLEVPGVINDAHLERDHAAMTFAKAIQKGRQGYGG